MVRQLAMAAPHTTRLTVRRPTHPVGGMGREGLKQDRPGTGDGAGDGAALTCVDEGATDAVGGVAHAVGAVLEGEGGHAGLKVLHQGGQLHRGAH